MSINVKKYIKDQMAKMVEDAQAEVQELKRGNATLTEQISQMNGEGITRENVIANLKADADALRIKCYIYCTQGRDARRLRELGELRRACTNSWYCESCAMRRENDGACGNESLQIDRAPQSWCYVEAMEDV